MTKHIHADLIMEYAQIAQTDNEPWRYFQCKNKNGDWDDCQSPVSFWVDREYRRRVPIIKIGDIDVPEPVREPPEYGTKYYTPDIRGNRGWGGASGCLSATWNDDRVDNRLLRRGLIHLNRESAELHAQALIALTSKY